MTFSFPDYLLFFTAIFNLMLCLFIFVNDPKNRINIWFAAFAFCLFFWSASLLFYRNVTLSYAHFWMRASYIGAMGIGLTFWYFVHFFPVKKKLNFYNSTLLLLVTAIVLIFFFNQGFISRNVIQLSNGQRTVLVDPFGYAIFTMYFGVFFFGAIFILWARYKKSGGLLKMHAQLLLTSVLVAGSFGVFFNLLLPSPFFRDFSFIHLGPFFTFFIALSVAYGIARYQLMNIKALLIEVFVILLILIQLLQVFFSHSNTDLILNSAILCAVLVVGFSVIRSVLSEVRRREEVTALAHSLEQANIRLQELDRQKTDFLSIAAHQLRTPLSILKGYIELIKDGGYGKVGEKVIGVLDNMDESNEHLVKLVDEFLNITRIEQGRTKFDFHKNNLNNIVASVAQELCEKAAQNNSPIKLELDEIFEGIFDDEKIHHVIFNFIDNAIKYGGQKAIIVKAEKNDNGLTVRVVDKGIGFDKVDEANFFQKFYRGNNVKGTNVNGTGLGLYVCRKFIEAHEGKIWAHSAGLGKGSEFGFWLPMGIKRDAGVKVESKNVV